MAQTKNWNWQQSDWPDFQYNSIDIKELEDSFLRHSGLLLGIFEHIDDDQQQQLIIEHMSGEAQKTSQIEGEILRRESIQSSICKQLGLPTPSESTSAAEAGIAHMMVDLYHRFEQPISHKMLHRWHAMLMNGCRDMNAVGHYRSDSEPMQIISGRMDKPIIHFQAPPSTQVQKEMGRFITWFNASAPNGKHPLPALARACIAHLYFESIHPFEDGNGRIGRALAEKSLAQSIGKPAILALSHTIEKNRKGYYAKLEKNNRSMQIDDWMQYFSETILAAQAQSIQLLEQVIAKNKFYSRYAASFNARQNKVIERIFKEGVDGFEGGLSASNYIRITGTSRATATRDLQELTAMGALTKTGVGKGTRYQLRLLSF